MKNGERPTGIIRTLPSLYGDASVVCAGCGQFHKQLEPSIKSAGEILDGMFDFARKNGE